MAAGAGREFVGLEARLAARMWAMGAPVRPQCTRVSCGEHGAWRRRRG